MKLTEKADFAAMITDAMAYYRQDASRFTLNVWWEGCKGFDFEQVSKALMAHATDAEHGRFAPKVSDIVRVLSGTMTDRAALAWGKVYESMSAVGAYADIVFDDPAIHAVIEDLGGWPKLCRMELKDLGYTQHRFCESHRAYTGRGEFDFPRRLMGDRSPDSDYKLKGLPPPQPAFVGNLEKAKTVYLGGNNGGKTSITFLSIDALYSPKNIASIQKIGM